MPIPSGFSWLDIQKKGESGDVYIYGTITDEKWFAEDVTPSWVRDEMARLKNASEITTHINSPGGGVFAGNAIYNLIKQQKAQKTTRIEGIAASISAVIAMSGDTVVMPKNTILMIHKAWGLAIGNAEELRKQADIMDKVDKTIVATFVEKTGQKEEKILEMMSSETWMLADEAQSLGFADVVEEEMKLAACVRGNITVVNGQEIDISKFMKFPVDKFNKPTEKPPADSAAFKQLEARHRHLHFSRKVAL